MRKHFRLTSSIVLIAQLIVQPGITSPAMASEPIPLEKEKLQPSIYNEKNAAKNIQNVDEKNDLFKMLGPDTRDGRFPAKPLSALFPYEMASLEVEFGKRDGTSKVAEAIIRYNGEKQRAGAYWERDEIKLEWTQAGGMIPDRSWKMSIHRSTSTAAGPWVIGTFSDEYFSIESRISESSHYSFDNGLLRTVHRMSSHEERYSSKRSDLYEYYDANPAHVMKVISNYDTFYEGSHHSGVTRGFYAGYDDRDQPRGGAFVSEHFGGGVGGVRDISPHYANFFEKAETATGDIATDSAWTPKLVQGDSYGEVKKGVLEQAYSKRSSISTPEGALVRESIYRKTNSGDFEEKVYKEGSNTGEELNFFVKGKGADFETGERDDIFLLPGLPIIGDEGDEKRTIVVGELYQSEANGELKFLGVGAGFQDGDGRITMFEEGEGDEFRDPNTGSRYRARNGRIYREPGVPPSVRRYVQERFGEGVSIIPSDVSDDEYVVEVKKRSPHLGEERSISIRFGATWANGRLRFNPRNIRASYVVSLEGSVSDSPDYYLVLAKELGDVLPRMIGTRGLGNDDLTVEIEGKKYTLGRDTLGNHVLVPKDR